MKLYKITLTGLYETNSIRCNPSFVVASDPAEAYNKVRNHLDNKDYGFKKDRGLKNIELIAEAKEYPDCGAMLFL